MCIRDRVSSGLATDRGFWTRGLCPGGLRPPILKFSFHVGDVWFCGFYPVLPLNGGLWPRGIMSGGLCPVTTTTHRREHTVCSVHCRRGHVKCSMLAMDVVISADVTSHLHLSLSAAESNPRLPSRTWHTWRFDAGVLRRNARWLVMRTF